MSKEKIIACVCCDAENPATYTYCFHCRCAPGEKWAAPVTEAAPKKSRHKAAKKRAKH